MACFMFYCPWESIRSRCGCFIFPILTPILYTNLLIAWTVRKGSLILFRPNFMQEKSKKASLIKLEELFGIDLRSLALLRMGLALIVIGDLINRSFDLRAHYTDFGVLPRKDLIESASNFWHVSIHLINGSVLVQSLLFLAAGVLAVGLFFGYRTRLVVPALWFLTISLHSRNLMINQGGDHLLRLLLFWGMFLPLGAVYSFDSALNSSTRQKPIRVVSAVTVALLLQVCFA